jgi:O-antigen/teichoic acid export membrane protein
MRISYNVALNSAGIVVPLIVGVVVIPKIVAGLGVERFGVLSVIWMMIGYFSVFDLGLGRTLTKLVADRLGTGDKDEIPNIVSTTLVIVSCSGILLGIGTAASAGWIARSVLHASPGQIQDTASAIIVLAVSLPFVLVATALFGLLEAFQAFALITAVRLPIGILTFVAPLAVLPLSKHLAPVTAALGGIRVVTTLILLVLCYRIVPKLRGRTFAFERRLVRPLLTYGGWLTVSNIIAPIMVYFDRFLIAAIAGSAAVAYYTVPYDVLSRLLLFPAALQAVLFPAFVTLRYTDTVRLRALFTKASDATLLLMFPALLATLMLGNTLLRLWMGPEFALQSGQVASILMVGVFINSMTRVPFALVQSAGHADWTALTHLTELPLYVFGVWWLLSMYGILGAAYAWTIRVLIDAMVFYSLGDRIEPNLRRDSVLSFSLTAILCVVALLLDWVTSALVMRVAVVGVCTVACGLLLVWRFRVALSMTLLPDKA